LIIGYSTAGIENILSMTRAWGKVMAAKKEKNMDKYCPVLISKKK
jgi:hypothetical protein